MTDKFPRKLAVEALEARTMLAGNVTADLDAAGNLFVRGDKFSNSVWIEGAAAGGYFVRGEDTTVNGQDDPVFFENILRSIRVSLRGGDDQLYVYDLQANKDLQVYGGHGQDSLILHDTHVRRHLRFHGGKLEDTLIRDDVSTVGRRELLKRVEHEQTIAAALGDLGFGGQALPDPNTTTQDIKLQQAISTLGVKRAEDQHLQAVDEIMEALFTSNLVPLPTTDPQDPTTAQDTTDMFSDTLQRMERAVEELDQYLGSRERGTDNSRAAAADARNFIQVTSEALQVIAQQTAQCDPAEFENPLAPGCQFLQQDDEGGSVVDNVLGQLFESRQVRSPFPIFGVTSVGSQIQEEVIPVGPLALNEIASVIKEVQGIKVVVTPRIVPVWVEPWFSRARIVGTKTVWTWEFVPAEFIKTITVANIPDTNGVPQAVTTFDTQVVLERELLHFWRYANKDITAVA